MFKFFKFLTESIGWLRIVASPLLIGLFIASLIYFPNPGSFTLVIAIVIASVGLIVGILWATKIWKGMGTITFLARLLGTPELNKQVDDPGANDKREQEK